MAIITLTTDFGEKDYFAGATRGAILSELPGVTIVDISHNVSPFNIPEAAYIIQNAYNNFPKGTIHIIGIDSELNPENKHIAVKLDGHYFVCANNGIMSMICSEIAPEDIVEINIHDKIRSSFTVLDVFVQVACHIARGGTLDVIGKKISEIKPIKGIKPYIKDDKTILGNIIYIDNYGNVVTNIKRNFFESIQKGRNFEITVRQYTFSKIYQKYSDIVNFDIPENKRNDEGRRLAVFNSGDFLEVAVYKSNSATTGSASSLLGLGIMDSVSVTFIPDPIKLDDVEYPQNIHRLSDFE
ncbi:SAM-dependent chlorinase/fluorinase [Tamlana haliotis]|uniref:SAM-dependent chlorinase/fluorinase n=1 Tax=Pseudotamlana haliotis TaxID=2614804 RepID=A0A6N6MEJ4_9FLAO|nr:SAM-dependent chlorinase/fluorinase [Tamlana haliotis]KAB1068671.1 SAM-dependent chlorinase/fluorinase [Tamlana haliotis]